MKDELVKRQDLPRSGNGGHATAGAVPPRASGSAYPISEIPAPRTIPLSGLDGRLDASWLPDYAADTGYGEMSPNGQTIVAPWMRLLQPLAMGDLIITVTANTMAIGDQVMLSHAARRNERATIVGGPRPLGTYWQYDLQRRGDGDFPAGSKVYDLGGAGGGGYVTIVSGDQADHLQAPHINLWTFDEGAGTERRLSRWGRLSGLSAEEKAYFPNVTDWSNVYGLYTDNLFARGWIYALGGHIAGDLGVTGRFTVKDPFRNARFEIGDTAGGWGAVLRNDAGRPVWGVATAYPDENGVLSDVAWWVESYGERAVWFRFDAQAQDWVLTIGPFNVNNRRLWGQYFSFSEEENNPHFIVFSPDHTRALLGVFANSDSVIMEAMSIQIGQFGSAVDLVGAIQLYGPTLGFFGKPPQVQRTVTGSRGGNAALNELLAVLHENGLIVNGTTV